MLTFTKHKIIHGLFVREILKVGKARHWKDVIRMLTKGQTDRLSVEPMLKYFHPLESWLKVRNRDESVIGWNIHMQDNALFQTLFNRCQNRQVNSVLLFFLLSNVVILNMYNL